MTINNDPLAITLFSEIATVDQIGRSRLKSALPEGMELSHFSILNHFAHLGGEKTPAQLARIFHVTKGAMTNTLARLSASGFVHIRPDWDDARRKRVSISPAGRAARDRAVQAVDPVFEDVIERLGPEKIRAMLPLLRELRTILLTD
ncbi:MAG: MarR family transcriptional regulator [Rhodobacteraceae bacterium]|nr:MarR family transcriptional regulator [Paracoccaceae bacterium]